MKREEARAMLERVARSRQKADVVIGIDPDIEKSGVSVIDARTKTIQYYALTFPELIEKCQNELRECEINGKRLRIIVEAGWINKGYWHVNPYDSKAVAARKGHDVGLNHGTGMKIVEYMEYHKFPVETIRPLKKCWKGKDGKITHEELNQQLVMYGFEPLKRTNQDIRDSVLLALLNI